MEICRRVKNAVADSEDRNSLFWNYCDQLEGLGATSTDPDFKGGCNLTDPITLIAFLDALSQMMQSLRNAAPVSVEAFTKDTEEDARIIEHDCAREYSRNNLQLFFYEAAHNACRDMAVPIYAGWKWQERQRRFTEYKDKTTGEIVPADLRHDDTE